MTLTSEEPVAAKATPQKDMLLSVKVTPTGYRDDHGEELMYVLIFRPLATNIQLVVKLSQLIDRAPGDGWKWQ